MYSKYMSEYINNKQQPSPGICHCAGLFPYTCSNVVTIGVRSELVGGPSKAVLSRDRQCRGEAACDVCVDAASLSGESAVGGEGKDNSLRPVPARFRRVGVGDLQAPVKQPEEERKRGSSRTGPQGTDSVTRGQSQPRLPVLSRQSGPGGGAAVHRNIKAEVGCGRGLGRPQGESSSGETRERKVCTDRSVVMCSTVPTVPPGDWKLQVPQL